MFNKISSSIHLDYFLLLRCIGALFVIRQHVDIRTLFPLDFIFIGNGNSGGQAVVLFFILSGFLISLVLQKKYLSSLQTVGSYYIRRIARIAPLYYFVTLFGVYFIFPYILQSGEYNTQLLQLFTFTYPGGLPYWNQVYWTLSIEAQFYLFAPVVVWVISRHSKWWVDTIGLVSCFAVLSVYPFITLITINPWWVVLLLGIFLQRVLSYIPYSITNNRAKLLTRFGSFALIWSVVALPWYIISPFDHTFFWIVICSILTSAAITCIQLSGGSAETYQRSIYIYKKYIIELINRIGHLSYAIFIFHMFILYRVNDTFRPFIQEHTNYNIASIAALFISIVLSIIVAEFLYRSIEKPGATWVLKMYNTLHTKHKNFSK